MRQKLPVVTGSEALQDVPAIACGDVGIAAVEGQPKAAQSAPRRSRATSQRSMCDTGTA